MCVCASTTLITLAMVVFGLGFVYTFERGVYYRVYRSEGREREKRKEKRNE